MSIKGIDTNFIHQIMLDSDTSEPKTVFHARTLRRTQRAQVSDLLAPIMAAVKNISTGGAAPAMSEEQLLNTALEVFELLIVDVTMMDTPVQKIQSRYGVGVARAWADQHLSEQQLFEAVIKAFAANVLTPDQKKTPDASSTSASSPAPATASTGATPATPTPADVEVKGSLSTTM